MDLYCERAAPGLFEEPFNTFTNIVFLIAAWRAWVTGRDLNALTTGTRLLIALLVCIGIGSTLFHSFATEWASLMDVAPILLFQLCYLWLYVRNLMGRGIGAALGLTTIFLVTVYFTQPFRNVLNGSLLYAPALILLGCLGLYHFQSKKRGRHLLITAMGLLIISLFFRTIDRVVCSDLPVGTHFIWHLLNGIVLYLVVNALLLNIKNSSQ